MITRLGTCHNYYNDTGRASSLPFRGAPEDTARYRALGAALQRAVARGSSFFHSFVHQIHTDILAPDSVLSPGGVHATVRETDRQIDNFISVLRERFFWPGLSQREMPGVRWIPGMVWQR